MAESTFVVFGDVHGRADLLAKLIAQAHADYGPDLQFVTLGDLIDRGPDSKGVLDLCVANNVMGIYGNHELWLMEAIRPGGLFEEGALASIMGGKATLQSFGVVIPAPGRGATRVAEDLRSTLTEDHVNFLTRLQLTAKLEVAGQTYYLIHAGLNKSLVDGIYRTVGNLNLPDDVLLMALEKSTPMSLLWTTPDVNGRNGGMYRFKNGIQIFGHLPQSKARVESHYIAMDTGCGTCAPFALSGLVLHNDGRVETFAVK